MKHAARKFVFVLLFMGTDPDTLRLQHDLLALPGPTLNTSAIAEEATRLAETIVTALHNIDYRYRIVGWPRLHNVAIHLGLRERGYCYHYVEDLFAVLGGTSWQYFEVVWAEAYGGTRRESNALALHRRGTSFSSGMVIDAWRTGGKVSWYPIEGDRWPWRPWDGRLSPRGRETLPTTSPPGPSAPRNARRSRHR